MSKKQNNRVNLSEIRLNLSYYQQLIKLMIYRYQALFQFNGKRNQTAWLN
jgi:hypothetical protein